ncbi:MAG TPA: HDOD domain-containing protein [Desulfobacterales bacterium]|nr:HDOD domain-containing protein [Desulfobacterales bacterium]
MKRKAKLFARLQRSHNLPSLPQVLLKLIEACDREDVDLSEISRILVRDPSISSRVLTLVNSAYFGLQTTFSDLEQAVVYLGANTIKSITVTASVQQVFSRFEKTNHFSMTRFWWDSFSSAAYAKKIAQQTDYANVEEAYLAGLLQGIGEILLWMNFPQKCDAVRTLVMESGKTQCLAEEELIGINHCEAGAWMMRQWKLNSFIADAILYHHAPLEKIEGAFPLVKIIRLADIFCHVQDKDDDFIYDAGDELLDLGAEQIEDIRTGVKEEVEEVAKSLGINLIPLSGVSADNKSATADEHDVDLLHQVKNYSLLTGFLKNLVQAESRDAILQAIEHAFHILFDVETIFFFLHDFEHKKLYGCGSTENRHGSQLQDLVLSAKQGSGLLLKSMKDRQLIRSLGSKDRQQGILADYQLRDAMGNRGLLYIPMIAKNRAIGVIVISLPNTLDNDLNSPSGSDLLQMLSNQAAIALYLDEVKRKQEQKIRDARQVTASMAAAKVVHEVNNPLGIIRNYLKILEMKLPEKGSLAKELTILDEEVNRISSIIERLDDFSTPIAYSVELTDIDSLLSNLLKIVSKSVFYSSRLKIHFKSNPELPSILTDAGAIKQIVINLVKNAAEAMVDGGNVYVETRVRTSDKTIPILGTVEESDCIELIIRDDGPGLPENVLSQLFEPFTSTKGKGHSGLGLSIVHTLVTELNGSVTCSSSKKNGTLFTISLPIKQ